MYGGYHYIEPTHEMRIYQFVEQAFIDEGYNIPLVSPALESRLVDKTVVSFVMHSTSYEHFEKYLALNGLKLNTRVFLRKSYLEKKGFNCAIIKPSFNDSRGYLSFQVTIVFSCDMLFL